MAKNHRTPNDQRSDSKNQNSREYKDSMDNHSKQLDPKHSSEDSED